jgi:hypothetical protein
MSDKFQTNIDLQGNSIEKGSFERLTTPPTEDNFLGRQIELNGVPHFYNGEEFVSFWQEKKANPENEAYVIQVLESDFIFVSLYNKILTKYGHVNASREIFVQLYKDCALQLNGNWPKNIRYNVHIMSAVENTINLQIFGTVSLYGTAPLDYSLSNLGETLSAEFINIAESSNPFFSGIPVPKINSENFWLKDKANAENINVISRGEGYYSNIINPSYEEWNNFPGIFPYYFQNCIKNNKPITRTLLFDSYNLNYPHRDNFSIKNIIGGISAEQRELIKGVRLEFYIIDQLYTSGDNNSNCYLYFPTNGSNGWYYYTNITDVVKGSEVPGTSEIDKNAIYARIKYTGLIKISIFNPGYGGGIFVYVENLDGQNPALSTALENTTTKELIKQFCQNNAVSFRNCEFNNSIFFNSIELFATIINKLNQDGGGAIGDFWSLLKANPEVSTALFQPLNTDTGIFAHLYADNRLKESRDVIIDFSTYAGGRVFTDFFSAYNLDNNNYPYSWTETNENSEKMKFVRYKMLLCNNPYTYPIAICVPDNPNIITNFSEVMTGLTYPNETQGRFFYLYPNQSVNVDFELIYLTGAEQPILAVININSFTGTATFDAQRTSSTENGTVISNYLTSNNIPCTVDKVTGQTLYNVQDLLANIITQINS